MTGDGMGGMTSQPFGSTGSNLTFGVFNHSTTFNGFLEALKTEGLLKIKAEPTLVTTNGRPANLLNGGEFPILVPQTLGVTTIQWREFGINLSAVPIILGNGRLRLELQPEVSERDFSNAVEVGGLVVPGLTTRRVNTQVEMKFGETLMLAGLIARQQNATTSKTPWIGEYPVIGTLFSRKEYNQSETELLILVTPEYVSPLDADTPVPGAPGDDTTIPTDKELFFDGLIEIPKYGDPAYCAPKPPAQINHCPPELNPSYCPTPYPQQPGSLPPMQHPEPLPPGDYESRMTPGAMPPPAPSIEAVDPPVLPETTELEIESEQVRKAAPFPPAPEDFWSQGSEQDENAQASASKDLERVSFKKVDSKSIRSRGQWAPRRTE
jgi:pilus assembly protein CpaC